jgi:preprotein translocase subunit SecA
LIPRLTQQQDEEGEGDFHVDLKAHTVMLSEAGHEKAEALMAESGLMPEGASLYDPSNILLIHHLYAALRAHALYHRDQHYVVQNGEVVIVDEFTGRMMPGRRWSEGLHQAVEAKEGVKIQNESQTLASITFQNYFRMYNRLSGMTGTADTEAYEFNQIYGLETVIIPTHRPMVRKDRMDQVFRSAREKHQAIIADIRDCHGRGQPVLVGTTSIENSELLSALLEKEALPHQVLNAKQHAREAEIVAQAGRPGVITIATNMAGRGTDIVLGGNPEPDIAAVEADAALDEVARPAQVATLRSEWQVRHDQVVAQGGLHIIGSERHESRRIDNQLRGRSGRQGDPGASRFYLSLEDPLLKIFASDRVAGIMDRLKMPEGEAIEHPWVTRAIENAQRKVEARNFDIRKQLLEYDDVSNDQRKVIYQQRNELLESEDISDTIVNIRNDVISTLFRSYVPADSAEESWDLPALKTALLDYRLDLPVEQWLAQDSGLDEEAVIARIQDAARVLYGSKFGTVDPASLHGYERAVMLHSVDSHWREHLAALDHLRQGIHLRGYAQKNPKQEYKSEAFQLFSGMLDTIKLEVTRILMQVEVASAADVEAAAAEEATDAPANVQFHHAGFEEALAAPAAREDDGLPKVGRNDPCPCGSGKKYKQCHGRLN